MFQVSGRIAAIVVLVVCSTGWLFAADPPADVLVEDSFESGQKEPDGWKRDGNVPGVKHVYDMSAGSEGNRSLSLQKAEERYFPIAGWTKSFPHNSTKSTLGLTAKVKAAKVTTAVIDVLFFNQAGAPISHEWVVYIGQKEPKDPIVTHDWESYAGAIQIPEGTKSIDIAFQIYGPGKVWFDELKASYFDSDEQAARYVSANGGAGPASTPDTSESPTPIELAVPSGGSTSYILIKPDESVKPPAEGFPLLVVLPGGDGSIEFHPFIREIHRQGLGGQFVVAQMIAPSQIVWPTRSSTARVATTEESIEAIIVDVRQRCGHDPKRVYALGWSSSGPAIYATVLQEKTPLAGAFIAMSVFKPDQLPPVTNAKGRRIYLLHSPDDKICPHAMAQDAKNKLTSSGAVVTLVDYAGGHGWHGSVFGNIRAGMDWLQASPK